LFGETQRNGKPHTSILSGIPVWGGEFRLGYIRMMPKQVPIGARGEAHEKVEFKHTLTAHHKRLPPVYSTPDMVRLMETAGFYALQPFCEPGEITVGTAINIEHRAACGVGARVHATAHLESTDGKFYVLRVSATADAKEIGRGTVTRAFVKLDRFDGPGQ
jgi:predicted thioesterase